MVTIDPENAPLDDLVEVLAVVIGTRPPALVRHALTRRRYAALVGHCSCLSTLGHAPGCPGNDDTFALALRDWAEAAA